MLEILPPGGLPPLTSREILDRATTVDFVTNAAFIEASKRAELPKPKVLASARGNTYTDLLARQIYLHYDAPIDGRIVAVKFLHHIGEIADKYYRIHKPQILDGSVFMLQNLNQMQRILSGTTNPSPEMRKELEDLRQKNGHLNEYALGRLRIVDRDGELRYYVVGAVPQAHSVLITIPIGANGGSHATLYRSFLEKLGK